MKFRILLSIIFSIGFSTLVQSQIESNKKKLKLSLKPKQNAPEQTKKTIPQKQAEQTIKYESQLLKKKEDPLMKALSNVPKIEVAEKKQYEIQFKQLIENNQRLVYKADFRQRLLFYKRNKKVGEIKAKGL